MNNKNNLEIIYAGKSDVGLVRSENQDSFGKFPEDSNDMYSEKGLLFIVADGIGGHSNGKEASLLAVDTVKEEYFSGIGDDIPNRMKLAVEKANAVIYGMSSASSQFKRMGTTCSALAIKNENAFIAHVGDSKIYHVTHGNITQLTVDHTLVGEMMKHGIISGEEAKQHPNKSTLLRALGGESSVSVDVIENIPVCAGDHFILCSDGLANVGIIEIRKIVSANLPADACDKLIELAKDRGGKDNVTVQVIRIAGQEDDKQAASLFSKRTYSLKMFWIPIIIIVAAILFFVLKTNSNPESENLSPIPGSSKELNNDVSGKSTVTPDTEQMFEAGVKLHEKGKLNSALKKYRAVLKISPTHLGAINGISKIAEEYKLTGKKLQANGKYLDALAMYNKSKSINSTDPELPDLINRCKYLISQGNN